MPKDDDVDRLIEKGKKLIENTKKMVDETEEFLFQQRRILGNKGLLPSKRVFCDYSDLTEKERVWNQKKDDKNVYNMMNLLEKKK